MSTWEDYFNFITEWMNSYYLLLWIGTGYKGKDVFLLGLFYPPPYTYSAQSNILQRLKALETLREKKFSIHK